MAKRSKVATQYKGLMKDIKDIENLIEKRDEKVDMLKEISPLKNVIKNKNLEILELEERDTVRGRIINEFKEQAKKNAEEILELKKKVAGKSRAIERVKELEEEVEGLQEDLEDIQVERDELVVEVTQLKSKLRNKGLENGEEQADTDYILDQIDKRIIKALKEAKLEWNTYDRPEFPVSRTRSWQTLPNHRIAPKE